MTDRVIGAGFRVAGDALLQATHGPQVAEMWRTPVYEELSKDEPSLDRIKDLFGSGTPIAPGGRSDALTLALSKNVDTEILSVLFDKAAAEQGLNSTDENGETPLHVAARTGNLDAVKLIVLSFMNAPLDPRSSPDLPIDPVGKFGYTPIVAAFFEGDLPDKNHLEVCKFLIRCGADIRPLSLPHAIRSGDSELVEMMLAAGEKVTTDDLRHAEKLGNRSMIEQIQQHLAKHPPDYVRNEDGPDYNPDKAMKWVVDARDTERARRLIERHGPKFLDDKLTEEMVWGSSRNIKYLLDQFGALAHLENLRDLAKATGRLELVEVISNHIHLTKAALAPQPADTGGAKADS